MSIYGSSKEVPILRLRAHHLCCEHFMKSEYAERGPEFLAMIRKVRKALLAKPQALVMLVEGPDDLCPPCPNFQNGGCVSENGNEEQVRKFDSILLSQVGLEYDTCLTSEEWLEIIVPKFPVRICRKCQWKSVCGMNEKIIDQPQD